MLDDSTGGMGSPGGVGPMGGTPATLDDFMAQARQYANQGRQPHAGLLGQLLFGNGGFQGMLREHMPNGILGGLYGGVKGMLSPGGEQPPAAGGAAPRPQAGPPMQLPGAMPQGGPPMQPQAQPPMLANAPMPNFGGAPQHPPQAPTQDASLGPWGNALSKFLGGVGIG